jgi:hypothetical protein
MGVVLGIDNGGDLLVPGSIGSLLEPYSSTLEDALRPLILDSAKGTILLVVY